MERDATSPFPLAIDSTMSMFSPKYGGCNSKSSSSLMAVEAVEAVMEAMAVEALTFVLFSVEVVARFIASKYFFDRCFFLAAPSGVMRV